MKNIVSIHQPSYFPWLGLLDKIKKSHLFVILDDVQLNDNAYQNRNLFLDNQNNEHLLTIPISKKNYTNKTIKDILISHDIWQKKHKKFIYFNYKKHPFFDEIFPLIQPIYEKKYEYLLDLLIDTMSRSFDLFDIRVKTMLASELTTDKSLKKEAMVIDILKQTHATQYLSGNGAKTYQKKENFSKNGIELIYQNFTHPTYQQVNNDSFKAGLSCLDAAFNLGKENCSKILEAKI